MINPIFLFLYISYISLLHPLHLSVCDIKFNKENHSLEISQRIFADDLENALRPIMGEKTDITHPAEPEKLSKAIGDYVLSNFGLSVNNKPLMPRYLGYELEEDVVWVYLEVPKVHQLNKIAVKNTLFFDIFEDQLNLININNGGRTQSIKLMPDQKVGELKF